MDDEEEVSAWRVAAALLITVLLVMLIAFGRGNASRPGAKAGPTGASAVATATP